MTSFHYAPKQVSDVKTTDSRVSLLGKIIGAGENSFVLDDGTGKIEIMSDFIPERNRLFRVFCSVADEKLKADVVQDMEGLDVNLLKKVEGLYNRAGV